jgi:hypothetical protein
MMAGHVDMKPAAYSKLNQQGHGDGMQTVLKGDIEGAAQTYIQCNAADAALHKKFGF